MHYNMLTISIIPIIISNYLHYKQGIFFMEQVYLWNFFFFFYRFSHKELCNKVNKTSNNYS